jgi:hypothetical protein
MHFQLAKLPLEVLTKQKLALPEVFLPPKFVLQIVIHLPEVILFQPNVVQLRWFLALIAEVSKVGL